MTRSTTSPVRTASYLANSVRTSPAPTSGSVSDVAGPLLGRELDDAVIHEVAAKAAKSAKPLDNADLSYVWRKRITSKAIEEAIREAAGAIG